MDNLDVNTKFKIISTNLGSIPSYDRNADALLSFVQRIDLMIPILESFPIEFKILLMGNIKDKIIGSARRSILINGNVDTWPEIKKIVVDNHGEQKSVDELIDKIRSCRCDSTIENFYNNLNALLCRLNNALYFSNNNSFEINCESNGRIALNSFKYGLPEPVRSIIVSRNPKNLKDAYDIIKSNGYLKYNNKKYCDHVTHITCSHSNFQQNNNKNSIRQNFNNNNDRQFRNSSRQNYNSNDSKSYYNKYNGQNFSKNNSGQPYNNNTTFQQRHANDSQNFSSQPMLSNRYSRQTGRQPENNFQTTNYIDTNRNPYSNQNYKNTSVEPMELGVNESFQNFQYPGKRNYPI